MNTPAFFPHGYCLQWNPPLIALYIVTDALVALSYYSIPAALFLLAFKRKTPVPVQPLLILFGLFIAFCGGGHVIDIVSLWKPVYWLKGWWNAFTATTSVITAVALIPRVMDIVRMPETTEKLKREKTELTEQHGLLRAVLDSAWDGVVLTGSDGKPLVYNSAAQRITGDEIPVVQWTGHGATDEDVVRLQNGRLVERYTREVPGFGQLYVLRDITERQASEEERMRLERVIETMRQGFAIIAAPSGAIVSTNPAFDEMYGYERGALLGRPFAGLLEDKDASAEATHHRIRQDVSRDRFWEGEVQARRADGTSFNALSRFNLHYGGEQQLFSLIQLDVTEQRRMEREARDFQEKMIETAKLESVGLLAGGIAHDFNNLLTGILGNASLVYEQLPPSSPLLPALNDVIKAGERAADLTRQLLAYSGKGRFVMGPIEINDLIQEINGLVRLSIPGHVRVSLDLGEPMLVEGDNAQLQQLLMNLIINAAEAVDETRVGLVQVTTRREGSEAVVKVRDNGSGMDEATVSRIFEPFFTTKFTGRGLGLAAATGIVRAHNGSIDVHSTPGEGTEFRVALPIMKNGSAPVAPDEREQTAPKLRGTVLVIDDEEPVRRAVQNMLGFEGFRILQAENGRVGVGVFTAHADEISLVLLDVTMPVMNGEETLRRLRAIRPDVKILVSSGFDEANTMKKFAGAGVAGFLAKPYKASQLTAKIREAL